MPRSTVCRIAREPTRTELVLAAVPASSTTSIGSLPNVTATDSFDGASVKLPQPIPVDQNDCTTPFIAGATTSTLRGPWYRNPLSAVTVLHADIARA
jgi:hypothetical protein